MQRHIITLEDYVKETRGDMKQMESSYNLNLQRIHEKIESWGQRPPIWATIIISILSAICTGLAVALSK